jgi:hypothetical protein
MGLPRIIWPLLRRYCLEWQSGAQMTAWRLNTQRHQFLRILNRRPTEPAGVKV